MVCSGRRPGARQQAKPDTLLGPEATPSGAVPPSWWWGVVFENWIVVASIKMYALSFAATCSFCAIFILWFL
ncbi:MAG: hypothetical protein CK429_09485 [Mycobacterium sp.]|nr:MAG: hypothetical protein CK429_09485 [Mycobacterium sp.]